MSGFQQIFHDVIGRLQISVERRICAFKQYISLWRGMTASCAFAAVAASKTDMPIMDCRRCPCTARLQRVAKPWNEISA
jgi:hypothetical protein